MSVISCVIWYNVNKAQITCCLFCNISPSRWVAVSRDLPVKYDIDSSGTNANMPTSIMIPRVLRLFNVAVWEFSAAEVETWLIGMCFGVCRAGKSTGSLFVPLQVLVLGGVVVEVPTCWTFYCHDLFSLETTVVLSQSRHFKCHIQNSATPWIWSLKDEEMYCARIYWQICILKQQSACFQHVTMWVTAGSAVSCCSFRSSNRNAHSDSWERKMPSTCSTVFSALLGRLTAAACGHFFVQQYECVHVYWCI